MTLCSLTGGQGYQEGRGSSFLQIVGNLMLQCYNVKSTTLNFTLLNKRNQLDSYEIHFIFWKLEVNYCAHNSLQ